MAHWIIDDHGFGGQFYRCSKCGDSWCDIYDDHLSDDVCPSCGEPIDHDKNEYIQDKKKANKFVLPELHIGSWKIDKTGWYFQGSGNDEEEEKI